MNGKRGARPSGGPVGGIKLIAAARSSGVKGGNPGGSSRTCPNKYAENCDN